MGVRDRLMAGVARQLRRPEGLRGRLTGRGLNKGNRDAVLAAVAATGLQPGQSAADIGFGGGVGLRPLLDRAGPEGHVHGIDLSDTMLAVAGRRFGPDVAAGRLSLHKADLVDLPLPDDSLDAVITINTVYFVADLDRAFAEIARVLRPTGTAVIGVGDPSAMAAMPVTAHGFTIRSIEDLVRDLRAAGFGEPRDQRVDTDERAFHLLLAGLEG
jgi:arsenite methyltransferase